MSAAMKYRAANAWERVEPRLHQEPNTGCWLWDGSLDKGYARITHAGRQLRVHRIVYEHFKGPIPPGMVLDHLCRVPCCANPDHLEAVTDRVNVLRGKGITARNARRTHCSRGHLLSSENVKPRSDGARECRTCTNEWRNKWRAQYGRRGRRALLDAARAASEGGA